MGDGLERWGIWEVTRRWFREMEHVGGNWEMV